MKAMKHNLLCQIIAAFLIVLIGGCSSDGNWSYSKLGGNEAPIEVQELATKAANNLQNQGFEVKQGYIRLYTMEDCWTAIANEGQCYGNNPAAPYVIPLVPAWSDEYSDSASLNFFRDAPEGFLTVRRFDPREAIIVIGRMPPAASYFGFQTYLYSFEGEIDTTSDVYKFIETSLPPPALPIFFQETGGRVIALSSISNNNNNVVFEEQAGPFWEQIRSFIITPDQTTDQIVRSSLARAGAPYSDVLTEPIPSSANVGLDSSAGDFLSVIRYAMPENEADGENWRHELPFVVLRVRDRQAGRAPEPYPPFEHPEARTSIDENYLSADLDALNNNVRAAWGLEPANDPPAMTDKMIDYQRAYPLDLVGPDCIGNTMNCLADTQDTTYSAKLGLVFEKDGANFLNAVVGTLGTKTENATYVSLAVYWSKYAAGVVNVSDAQLESSQQNFPLGPTPFANGDKFFLWYFGRSCAAVETENCTEVSEDEVPLNEPFSLVMRNYIKPGTDRGPNTEPPDDPKGVSPLLTSWVITIPVE